jgi:hypothetical protein
MPTGEPGTLDYYLSMVTSQYAGIDNPISVVDYTAASFLVTEDSEVIIVGGDGITVSDALITFPSKFMATLASLIIPFTELIALAENMYKYFNIDTAVGDQLDKLGEWLNISRYVPIQLPSVYFELDSDPLGLDRGTMFGPGDSLTGLTALSDDLYRKVIKAHIYINNNLPVKDTYYTALTPLFTPAQLVIQGDNANNLFYGLTSTPNDIVAINLFTEGYFNFAPAGVNAFGFSISSSSTAVPFFGFDEDNSAVSGFDVGYMP